jgi:hypothetical protein
MEIRIRLDRAEPRTGRLRVLPEPGRFAGAHDGKGVSFAGWLGLLRALEQAIGSLDEPAPDAE